MKEILSVNLLKRLHAIYSMIHTTTYDIFRNTVGLELKNHAHNKPQGLSALDTVHKLRHNWNLKATE